uniref:Transposase, MuDR, MULE transposase domain protein n=1 Tax=Tanacetum cinerariifolium TaxID=118510 RepID=A0A6L2NWU5_TANCI|nr:transposase, MuDR, MULE transposase domain protein [Tanacetum cinerariifolium]
MSTLIFAKTHNLIAYLAKPTKSEGFEQIIDFLNGSSVSYALTASLTIRTSCIKQFWTTAKVKTINDEVRIQALIDEKRVNIKESSIHHTLKLNDAEGTSCLANVEIFDGLAKMGYEKLSEKLTFYKAFFLPQWNTMASSIICLATNLKFNFSRFVQLLIDNQLGDMSHHKDIYDNPSLTKKVFTNMKRVGTGFSEDANDEKPVGVKEVLKVVKVAKLMTEVVTTAGATTTAKATKQPNCLNKRIFRMVGEECVMSTKEYIKKVVEDVGEDEDIMYDSWVNAIEYVNANAGIVSGCLGDIKNFIKNRKLDQVFAIVKSCTPNVLGD